MTKPLELTIHPPIEPPTPETFDQWRRLKQLSRQFVMAKRFTDAELAAEYWRSWNNVKTGSTETRDWTEYDRATTIRRFAQTPSYDEVPAS